MKLTVDTQSKDRKSHATFLKKCEALVKSMGFYGTRQEDPMLGVSNEPMNIDQLLRIHSMMGNVEGVVFALELGGSLDYTLNGASTRDLIKAYQHKDVQKVIGDYEPQDSTAQTKPMTGKK